MFFCKKMKFCGIAKLQYLGPIHAFFYISYVFVIKKFSRCLQKLQDNKNLEHKENIPEIHIVFSLHLQDK